MDCCRVAMSEVVIAIVWGGVWDVAGAFVRARVEAAAERARVVAVVRGCDVRSAASFVRTSWKEPVLLLFDSYQSN